MPSRFRSLVVSADDDFREELVERAISLNFSVRAIHLPDELPRLMRRYGFDWLILDLALGESGCLQIIERLAAESPPPRVILVDGRSEAEVRAIMADIREADSLGEDMGRLITATSEISEIIREAENVLAQFKAVSDHGKNPSTSF